MMICVRLNMVLLCTFLYKSYKQFLLISFIILDF